MPKPTMSPDAIQFNAGYHAGATNAKAGAMAVPVVLHPAWLAGHEYGERDQKAGTYRQHAKAAWDEYQSAKTRMAA